MSVSSEQPTLPNRLAWKPLFGWDGVFNIKMPLGFVVLLDDMLPVLIPTD